MEAYRKHNHLKVLLLLGAVFFSLLWTGLWLQSTFFHSAGDIDANVYPSTLSVGDTLFYTDKSAFTALKEWHFGDGNSSVNDSGFYFYKKPGYYQVKLTLNGQYTKEFAITVLPQAGEKLMDSMTTMEAPHQVMQYENVVFRAHSKYAKVFVWKFGDSHTIDAREKVAIYAYQTPGDYTVTLYTDETAYPITQQIRVLPSFKLRNDSLSVDDMYNKIDDDFKYHLQQIANSTQVNQHYKYLLTKYLCQQENTPVKVNSNKINSFYYYCAGLQFDRNRIIERVKVGFDDDMNCVTQIEIIQDK
ncbi:hypothetical protein ACL9RF_04755 [Sphingobacterium sp. Mn56C]|uniref:hypothetical protein n=1 Tax=Sphingobacterium sp. Mn56C TaxID=3395261 RepID=UPI003BBB1F0E